MPPVSALDLVLLESQFLLKDVFRNLILFFRYSSSDISAKGSFIVMPSIYSREANASLNNQILARYAGTKDSKNIC